MEEIWKDIKGYEKRYQISNFGRVKSCERYVRSKDNSKKVVHEKILKTIITNRGYEQIVLRKNGKHYAFNIHRLVAICFIPNPNNYKEVNHIDGNKLNNYVKNLEWCTRKHNEKEAYRLGLVKNHHKFPKGHIPHNIRKVNQYDLNGNYLNTYSSIAEASRKTCSNPICIGNCCREKQPATNGYTFRYAD